MYDDEVLMLPESEWNKAKHRNEVIAPLAELNVLGKQAAKDAATLLGVTTRQVYRLIKCYRMGKRLVTDIACKTSCGGKGKSRLSPEVEVIISNVIETLYLSRERPSKAVIRREILMRCRQAGLRPPSYNSIGLRISMLDPLLVIRKRHGGTEAKKLQPAAGQMPPPAGPMELVQIDHSPVDLIIVDEIGRLPIGRPWLTLAIDIYTRCIVGMLLTLEAPSATSVGLCLAHAVTEKSAWLQSRGVETSTWSMHGKPKKIHLDNAREFISEALKRGCEQYDISRDYRPKKQPHYGGIIERVIGTAMTMAHTVPGTTFSNVQERGTYKSETKAILTLAELEKWLILAIGVYHGTVHKSLSETPASVWNRSVQSWKVAGVADKKKFLIDFLPVIRRRITRTGFSIDHIMYYADVLKPWIAKRKQLEKFIIRRDPRDISRVWVLDPSSKLYIDIPYRYLSHPSVTLWEHRKAVENLRKQGRDQVNEMELFRMMEQMREIKTAAAKETKRARRERSRRSHLINSATENKLLVPADQVADGKKVAPFDSEEWTVTDVGIPLPAEQTGKNNTTIKPFEVEEW